MDTITFSKIGTLLVKSKNILLFLPAAPSVDAAAAGLALYLSLKAMGKQIALVCSEKISVGLNRLIAVDKISNQVGGQNLVASFEYTEDSIEKVSYNIKNGKFNLVIQPKEGYPPLDYRKLTYNYTGSTADSVIAIGCQKPELIGRLYEEEKKLFSDQETVNIDNNHFNSRWGKTNLVDSLASSCSELVGLIIKNLNMTVNPDIATNILSGMEAGTNNFNFKTRAETFELIAWAMQAGGRRLQMQPAPSRQPFDVKPFMSSAMRAGTSAPAITPSYPSQSSAPSSPAFPFPTSFFNQPYNQSAGQNLNRVYNQANGSIPSQSYNFGFPPFSPPGVEPVPPPGFNLGNEKVQPPVGNVQPQPTSVGGQQTDNQGGVDTGESGLPAGRQTGDEKTPSPDWLKPKIYKGSSQV